MLSIKSIHYFQNIIIERTFIAKHKYYIIIIWNRFH